jgi:acetolactate synthase-1/2/3 large subunit
MACLHVLGDQHTIFENLINDVSCINKPHSFSTSEGKTAHSQNDDTYIPSALTINHEDKYFSDDMPLKPQRLMRELAQNFPENTRYHIDVGNAWAWATHYLLLNSPGKARIEFGFGAMTWAIGTAIGTALGCQDNPVVCITGDGSFLMSSQEITTAVAEQLPIIFVVLNDQALGMIKHGQRLSGAEPIAYKMPPVDFAAMARAMGANAHTIRTWDDFTSLDIESICTTGGPTLLDVYIDPDEVPPLGVRIKTLRGHG